MKIIVHFPKSEEAIAELQKRVSTVHIEAVTEYLTQLSCPQHQKLALLESLKRSSQKDNL